MNTSHNKNRVSVFLFIAAFLLALLTTASIRAGTITLVNLPATGTDAATGISSANTYLCCLAFGSSANVTIGGVPFKQVKPGGVTPPVSGTDSTHGGTYSLTANHNLNSTGNSAAGQADGQTLVMLGNVVFVQSSAPVGSDLDQTYGGLTAGATYALRLYYRKWVTPDTRPINVYFNGEGTANNQGYTGNPLDESAGGAHYIEYDFTAASTTVNVYMTNTVANESAMISGMSLQFISSAPVAASITTQPVGVVNWAGLNKSLSVSASGNPTPTYQWYQNGSLLSGATSPGLTFSPLADGNAGSYYVIVQNTINSVVNSVQSSTVLVTVQDSPITNVISSTLSQVLLPPTGTDAATGIGTGINIDYLCALDFGNPGFTGQVNGINFTPLTLTGTSQSGTDPNYNGTWTASTTDSLGFKDVAGGGTTPVPGQADGNMAHVLNGANYLGIAPIGTTATFDFGGLTVGGNYALRYYYVQWAADSPLRTFQFTFNGDGNNASFTVDEDAGEFGEGGADYVEYDFTAARSDVSLLLTDESSQANYGPMIYAMTLSWNTSLSDYILVSSPQLPATSWTPTAGVVNNSVTVDASTGTEFFALQQQ